MCKAEIGNAILKLNHICERGLFGRAPWKMKTDTHTHTDIQTESGERYKLNTFITHRIPTKSHNSKYESIPIAVHEECLLPVGESSFWRQGTSQDVSPPASSIGFAFCMPGP
jgi:hypothetical protein